MDKKVEKRRDVGTYVDILSCYRLTATNADYVLLAAIDDGVTTLTVSKEEHNVIRVFILANGGWNWDGETILTMKLEVQ